MCYFSELKKTFIFLDFEDFFGDPPPPLKNIKKWEKICVFFRAKKRKIRKNRGGGIWKNLRMVSTFRKKMLVEKKTIVGSQHTFSYSDPDFGEDGEGWDGVEVVTISGIQYCQHTRHLWSKSHQNRFTPRVTPTKSHFWTISSKISSKISSTF